MARTAHKSPDGNGGPDDMLRMKRPEIAAVEAPRMLGNQEQFAAPERAAASPER